MFAAKDRLIYADVSGKSLDPLVVRRKLMLATKGELNALLDQAAGSDPLPALAAEEALAGAARTAFDFPAFTPDGGGATDLDCLEELNRFVEWVEKKL
ncbi:hypothetical protein [Limnoglobus roseus]|uniref:Uncharacterized protein n=1 Tax=Limnoglobus roseus TaxID=2598579 RepID=A0A5C1AQE5_9BACT|nr:hypothetical protein [Limnoglobus roseus]QEL19078.1 hypothetical protein PX52LOC_06135 [Limnoglobus roseus]